MNYKILIMLSLFFSSHAFSMYPIDQIEKQGFVKYIQVNLGDHDNQTQITIKTSTEKQFACQDVNGTISSRVLSFLTIASLSMEKSYEIYESKTDDTCSIGVVKD